MLCYSYTWVGREGEREEGKEGKTAPSMDPILAPARARPYYPMYYFLKDLPTYPVHILYATL